MLIKRFVRLKDIFGHINKKSNLLNYVCTMFVEEGINQNQEEGIK